MPRVVENSADADIDVVLCRHVGDGSDVIGSITAAESASYGTSVVPITTTNEAFPITAQVTLQITPHRAGSVRVEGIELTCRDGIRYGAVHTGVQTIITAS